MSQLYAVNNFCPPRLNNYPNPLSDRLPRLFFSREEFNFTLDSKEIYAWSHQHIATGVVKLVLKLQIMTFEEYKKSLQESQVPEQLSNPLKALWYEAQGNWEKAHDYAQAENDSESAWVHAYLHRKEGDTMNAQYWYTRASRSMPDMTLEQEWEKITKILLS